MAKKKSDEERKPDLNEAQNQAEVEARIKEMMELDEPPASKAKSIKISMHDEPPISAPELPGAKESRSIKVIDHNEVSEPDIDQPEGQTQIQEIDPEVLEAIEEANKQLLGTQEEATETANEQDNEIEEEIAEEPVKPSKKIEILEQEPDPEEAPKELEEETQPVSNQDIPSAPELADISDDQETIELDEIEKAFAEEVSDSTESEDTEEPEPTKPVPAQPKTPKAKKPVAVPSEESASQSKEKPLKHLDSIIPKTKVEETIESIGTGKAVDDILAKEADALLELQDQKLGQTVVLQPKIERPKKHLGLFKKKVLVWFILLTLTASIAVALVTPTSRYAILNMIGVRSSASLTVLDETTQQPLKGVRVTMSGIEESTDQDGKVTLSNLRLGRTTLAIEKRGFASISRDLVIGWGSNPLGNSTLKPTGSRYVFVVTDFLSGKPLAKVEAVSNEASALSNDKGEITLTIDQQTDTSREVTLIKEGYREEKFSLSLDQSEPVLRKLVPARKHVFISDRGGRFDVYKTDIDGQNEKLVLPGTGSERGDMVLVPHPTDEVAALVSTRDNKRNDDGFLLSTLTVLDLRSETTKYVVTAERVQVIDWIGTRIVYVQTKEGADSESSDRHVLMSYDYSSQQLKQLATSNYFNDVLIAGGQIYVAPSSAYAQTKDISLLRIGADGASRQTILAKEVSNIFRSSYNTLTFASGQDWYELRLSESKPGKLSGEPPKQTSRIYVDGPNKNQSLWVDNRDGKGMLLAHATDSGKDDTIRSQAGLRYPVRWLSQNTVIYRVKTESETADYALNIDGGEPVKVSNVADTSGTDTWYYY